MKTSFWFGCALSVMGSCLFFACEEKAPAVPEKPSPVTENIETTRLGDAVDAYIAAPSVENSAAVDRATSQLDGEIAELNQQVADASGSERTEAKRKAGDLVVYRDKEILRYKAAQAKAEVDGEKNP